MKANRAEIQVLAAKDESWVNDVMWIYTVGMRTHDLPELVMRDLLPSQVEGRSKMLRDLAESIISRKGTPDEVTVDATVHLANRRYFRFSDGSDEFAVDEADGPVWIASLGVML